MTRHLLTLCISLVCISAATTRADTDARPNVILCMADDLGWGDVGYQGNTIVHTPQLDEMSAAGIRFERFYSGAPVCSPTRGSALTGRHPYRYGIYGANKGHLPRQEPNLAVTLGRAGYATGHFGKWHLGVLTTAVKDSNRGGPRGTAHYAPPWERGFDESFSTEAKVPTHHPLLRPRGEKRNTWWHANSNPDETEFYGTAYWHNGHRIASGLEGDDSEAIMDHALEFIEHSVDAKRPFFAVIWFHAPHLPVVASAADRHRYADLPPFAQHYFGCITALDRQIGRLRHSLRSLGVGDNTMLWFTSDNGPEGRPGPNGRGIANAGKPDASPGSSGGLRGRKRSLYEGGVRVPGLLEWPAKIPTARTVSLPASTLDYYPTIVAASGAAATDDTPRPLDGVNLLPLIDGNMSARPRPIPFESHERVALVGDRYKLIGPAPSAHEALDTAACELYDIGTDRAERHDVSAAHTDVVTVMAAALRAWRGSCERSRAGADY